MLAHINSIFYTFQFIYEANIKDIMLSPCGLQPLLCA